MATPAEQVQTFEDLTKRMELMFTKQTEDITKQINDVKSELADTKKEIQVVDNKLEDIIKCIQLNEVGITENRTEISKLKTELLLVKRSLLMQEAYSRRNSLLIYGIPDERDPIRAVNDLFTKSLQLDNVDEFQYENIHRLNRTSTDPANFRADMPKPIAVRFLSSTDKQRVFNASLRHSKTLREQRISVRTDLPVIVKKQRGRLANLAFERRKSDKVQTRIIEKGINLRLECRKSAKEPWVLIEETHN